MLNVLKSSIVRTSIRNNPAFFPAEKTRRLFPALREITNATVEANTCSMSVMNNSGKYDLKAILGRLETIRLLKTKKYQHIWDFATEKGQPEYGS